MGIRTATKTAEVYTAGYGSDSKHCVYGPGAGFGFDAGTLWPNCRLSSGPDAEAAAKLCNEAFRIGYAQAQRDIREALGVKP